jgi:hypothetical protein
MYADCMSVSEVVRNTLALSGKMVGMHICLEKSKRT